MKIQVVIPDQYSKTMDMPACPREGEYIILDFRQGEVTSRVLKVIHRPHLAEDFKIQVQVKEIS